MVEFAGDACSLRTGCCSRCSSWHQGCNGCLLGGPACSSTALGPAGSASSCSAASARPHRPHVTDLQPSACTCKTTETPHIYKPSACFYLQDHRDPTHLQTISLLLFARPQRPHTFTNHQLASICKTTETLHIYNHQLAVACPPMHHW